MYYPLTNYQVRLVLAGLNMLLEAGHNVTGNLCEKNLTVDLMHQIKQEFKSRSDTGMALTVCN